MGRMGEVQAALPMRLSRWSAYFCAAELAYGIDPLLLAAICDRESLGGESLVPKGPMGTGDHGHGRGLMQIDDRAHPNFTFATFEEDGTYMWKDPAFNVMYSARLMRHNLMVLQGDLNGAIAAYNCGVGRVRKTLASLPPDCAPEVKLAALNALTTGGDYVSDVVRRRASFPIK